MVTCCVCSREARVGTLCDDCRDPLIGTVSITGEQIQPPIGIPLASALVDVWGNVHRLRADTWIGRTPDEKLFAISEASVSRRHARLTREPAGWTLSDLGSANGTFVDDVRVSAPVVVRDRARIRFGFISFYFLLDASGLVPPHPLPFGQTEKPFAPVAMAIVDERTGPITHPLRRHASIDVLQPSGGGGGVVRVDGRTVQLTLPQYELVSTLFAQMVKDAGRADDARGYISSDHLARVLSLDCTEPTDDHIRQLVRRVRRRFHDEGIGDIIESKYGLGYRLAVTPR